MYLVSGLLGRDVNLEAFISASIAVQGGLAVRQRLLSHLMCGIGTIRCTKRLPSLHRLATMTCICKEIAVCVYVTALANRNR